MEDKHTPTPWQFEKHAEGGNFYGNITALLGKNENGVMNRRTITCQTNYDTPEVNEANAQFIVKAVNNHDKLLGENKRYREALDIIAIQTKTEDMDVEAWTQADFEGAYNMMIDEAKQALNNLEEL